MTNTDTKRYGPWVRCAKSRWVQGEAKSGGYQSFVNPREVRFRLATVVAGSPLLDRFFEACSFYESMDEVRDES